PSGDGGAGGGGQGAKPAGPADQAGGALAWRSPGGEPSPGACAVPRGGDRAVHSSQTLRRGGGRAGGHLPRPAAGRRPATESFKVSHGGSGKSGNAQPSRRMGHSSGGGGPGVRDAGAVAVAAAGFAAGRQPDRGRAGAAFGHSDSAASAVFRVSQPASA